MAAAFNPPPQPGAFQLPSAPLPPPSQPSPALQQFIQQSLSKPQAYQPPRPVEKTDSSALVPGKGKRI